MGVDRQTAFCLFIQKVLVDLILRDKHFVLPKKVRLCGKVPLRVWQAVENDADTVGVVL